MSTGLKLGDTGGCSTVATGVKLGNTGGCDTVATSVKLEVTLMAVTLWRLV